jgi:hypothetical protein
VTLFTWAMASTLENFRMITLVSQYGHGLL